MNRTLAALAVVLLLLAGCYETSFVLGPVAEAKIDRSLLGHWNFDGLGADGTDRATLDVAEFDKHRYKLDWTTHNDGKVMKMAGHVVAVKGKLFVHAAGLDALGQPGPKHWLIRIDRDGDDTIALSNLDTEFLASKKIDSDTSLRAAIEASLDDPNLYESDVMVGKRAK